ncbi:MAG: hypothetical protein ACRDL4_21360 [Thermoleophilaceae bacterium]
MTDALALAQRTGMGVGPVVVAHQALGRDAMGGEEAKRALDERDHGRRSLVAVQLRVSHARVVVDD